MKYTTTLAATPTYMLGGFNFKIVTLPSLPSNFIFEGIEKKIKYSDHKNNYHWIDVIYINQYPYILTNGALSTFVLKSQVAFYNPLYSNR